MLILLTILFFGLTLLCALNPTVKTLDELVNHNLTLASVFLSLSFLIISVLMGISIVNGRTLESKIVMYTEENEHIENDMNVLVKQYMDYESDTYKELKNESSVTLVSLYPELKADALVAKQLEIYTANKEKIKKLKERKIDLSVKRWWLYFGH